MSNFIIFDLDGVITSEEAYWDAAGLTLHELCYSPRYWHLDAALAQYYPVMGASESRRVSRALLPEAEIMSLKARAINSNWDTCYVAVCLHLLSVLAESDNLAPLLPLRPWDADWLSALRALRPGSWQPRQVSMDILDAPVFKGAVGLELINRIDAHASQVLGQAIGDVFSRLSPFWAFCQAIFQEWYLGDQLYLESYGQAPAQPAKEGCIHFEQPLLPLVRIRGALAALREQGYVLGCATGRLYEEAAYPLKAYDLWQYFAAGHIATYDCVERVEARLRTRGDSTLLGKPHPFQFLVALDAANEEQERAARAPSGNFVVVGDSPSDILGGRAAGGLTIAVLTGARTAAARARLAQSEPDFTIDDVTDLPALLARIDTLATIQRMQFGTREKAERLLRRWFARHMRLEAESVTLTPKAVSLNSFNGLYRLNGEEFFFKTHVEEGSVLEEYYHAELLRQAGYNIVTPLQTLHEEGRQMVIYPLLRCPVVFELARALELGQAVPRTLETLVAAERRECERLLAIYEATLARIPADENARAPIHQLFWHRLTGGRLRSFYARQNVPLPGGRAVAFEDVLASSWTIKTPGRPARRLRFTLGELLARASVVLDPAREALSVIGHGDAHYGNVFLQDQRAFLYFDPAFAGRHDPLLDIIKPLYHNIFATWMYFPREVDGELELSVRVGDGHIYLEHNFELTPLRRAIAAVKREHLLRPLFELLGGVGRWDAGAAAEFLSLALLCCPLLTINLLDGQRIPAAISWLGLAHAVQLGQEPLLSDIA